MFINKITTTTPLSSSMISERPRLQPS